MKKTFVDPGTGWTVTQETSINSETGAEEIEETIADPRPEKRITALDWQVIPSASLRGFKRSPRRRKR